MSLFLFAGFFSFAFGLAMRLRWETADTLQGAVVKSIVRMRRIEGANADVGRAPWDGGTMVYGMVWPDGRAVGARRRARTRQGAKADRPIPVYTKRRP
jgi:hypothetical protein